MVAVRVWTGGGRKEVSGLCVLKVYIQSPPPVVPPGVLHGSRRWALAPCRAWPQQPPLLTHLQQRGQKHGSKLCRNRQHQGSVHVTENHREDQTIWCMHFKFTKKPFFPPSITFFTVPRRKWSFIGRNRIACHNHSNLMKSIYCCHQQLKVYLSHHIIIKKRI